MKKIFLITITTFCLAANLYSAKKVVVVGDKLNIYSENGSELSEIDLHVQPFDIKFFSGESHTDCKSYYDNGKVKRIEYFFRKKQAGSVDFTRTGEIRKAFIIYKTGFETDVYYGGGRQVREIIKNVGLIRKGYPAEYHYFFSVRGELNRIDIYYKESGQSYILKENITFENEEARLEDIDYMGIKDEEYNVYSYIINEFEKQSEKRNTLVVCDETTLHSFSKFDQKTVEYLQKEGVKLSEDIIKDFSIKNKRPYKFINKFKTNVTTLLISEIDKEEIFNREKGWEYFYKIYPDSWIAEISRVAFNSSKDIAFVYFGTRGDYGHGGIGYYILLNKRDGKWIIDKRVTAWIS